MIIAVGISCFILGVVVGMLIGAAIVYDALGLVSSDRTEHGDFPL